MKRDLKLRARFLEIIQANYGGNLRQVDFSQPKAVAKVCASFRWFIASLQPGNCTRWKDGCYGYIYICPVAYIFLGTWSFPYNCQGECAESFLLNNIDSCFHIEADNNFFNVLRQRKLHFRFAGDKRLRAERDQLKDPQSCQRWHVQ